MICDETFNVGDADEWEGGLDMKAYVADFETTTDPEDCRVWAWCVCDVDNVDFLRYGTDIESFLRWCKARGTCQMYFHNLGFDGSFIMDYLERNGWEWVEDAQDVTANSYTTLISDNNMVYSLTLYFDKYTKVRIYDSLKIVPLSVKAMAKAYGLDEGKGELDYETYRAPGHELTDEEKDYIRRDVQIVAHVMHRYLDEGLTKMTAGSNALWNYKQMCNGSKHFRRVYPELEPEEDSFIRKAYRGGFTWCNPEYQGKLLGAGMVFDVNSLYPSVMAACDGQLLPHGKPQWFSGEPKPDSRYPLWVAVVTCTFKLKKDHVPCIQLKGNFRYRQTEYLSDSMGEVSFAITNVDWELITRQYDLRHVRWQGGYKFQASTEQFKGYVDRWIEVKNQATIDGNSGMRQIAKLMLNSLYGKFATRTTVRSRRPMMVDGILRYVDLEPQERKPVYLPVGVFVTSWARYKTISSAQEVYGRFAYADTDSLHLVGTDMPTTIDVDPVKLGAWKHESTFEHAKFLRQKTYAEQIDGKMTVHVAGMPANVHSQVTFDNFHLGAVYDGKLYQRHVPGGIVLVPGEMEIRA